MCYRCKEIKNPVKHNHLSGFDPVKISTQCGKCPSCRKVKSSDWFVRAYFETMNNPDKQVYFCSLDFDSEHLPYYPSKPLMNSDILKKGKPCFDSEIMKKFLKRLRYEIGSFRYLYVTEFGGLLKRPHYHLMVMPDNFIPYTVFMCHVFKQWKCGHHTHISKLEELQDNRLAAIQYMTGYATKDITFDQDDFDQTDEKMPARFRPRIQASKGFGLQALRDGDITLDMILEGKPITIPCGKNGKLVKFSIPRYYEVKIGYDSIWHPKEMKQELIKNELGVKIQQAKHNRRYVYQVKSFFSSRLNGYDSGDFFEHRPWYNVVLDCLDNFDDFCEFVYYRPFIKFQDRLGTVFDTVRNEYLSRPYWSYYAAAYKIYLDEKKRLDAVKDKLETELLIRAAKERTRKKIKNNPQLYRYLIRKNFDFSTLNT